jgi:hypothetical protein
MTHVHQRINRSRSIRFLVLIGIVAAIVLTIWALIPPPEITFKDFPVDKPQIINFDVSSKSFSRLTEREQKDQRLDWLVFAIASDRDFKTDLINETFYDLPTMRHDYMKPVANFEYGETRQINLGNGKVVALVPKNEENRIENIAYITDSYRKDTSEIPEKIQVFEYELNADGKSAELKHTSDLNGKEFYTSKYGYYEERIDNSADLKKFIAEVNDITYSSREANQLVLGGRKISNRPTNMTLEDVAALWQSEKAITKDHEEHKNSPEKSKYKNINASGFSLDWDYNYKKLAEDLNEAQSFLADFKLKGKAIITDKEIKDAQLALSKAQLPSSEKDISLYSRLIKKIKENKNIFFDPRDRALEIKQKNIEIRRQELIEKRAVLDERDKNYSIEKDAIQNSITSAVDLSKLNIEGTLISREWQKYNNSVDQYSKEDKEITDEIKVYNQLIVQYNKLSHSPKVNGFQFARYNGTLKGTEVGMTLFYTDLIAKLWSIGYTKSIPIEQIVDFIPRTKIASTISSIYQDQSNKNDYTRLWFDLQEQGYQKAKINNGSSLIFAPNATKINAKSSNSGELHKESEAEPNSQLFIDWWDRHYDELARFEPQYQKLNQIMKWSIFIGWLNGTEQGNALDKFLNSKSVKVNDKNWFPDWAQTHKQQLKFQLWDNQSPCNNFKNDAGNPICFYGRNTHNAQAEALPFLSSYEEPGKTYSHSLYGGVSLAEKSSIGMRAPLPEAPPIIESGLRVNINYKSFKPQANGFSFIKNSPTKGEIDQSIKFTFVKNDLSKKIGAVSKIQVAKAVKLRGQLSEINNLGNLEFTSNISRESNGIKISTTAKGIPVEDFSTTKTPNGFTIGFKSRDIDAGQSLALAMSEAAVAEEALLKDANVLSAYKEGSVFYIETKDSTQVLKLTPDGGSGGKGGGGNGGGGKPPKDWDVHVGSAGGGGEGGGNGGGGEPPKGPNVAGGSGEGGSKSNYYGSWEKKKKGYKDGKVKIVDRDIPPPHGLETPTQLLHHAVDLVKQGKLKVRSLVLDSSGLKWTQQPADFPNEVGSMLSKNKFKVFIKDDAYVYVQDTPGLNNHNWDGVFESASTPSGRSKQRVYQFTGKGLSDFGYKPEKLKSSSSSQDYKVSKGSFSQLPIVGGGSDENCENGISENGKCMKVYVVIEAPELEQPIEPSLR